MVVFKKSYIFASTNKTKNNLNTGGNGKQRHKIMKTTTNNTESKKMTIDEEMAMWEARANDEFGKTLKEIEKASMNYFGCDEDEYGIRSTPLSYLITAYSLDGNRKHTAKVFIATLEEWDILEDENIKAMTDKLNKLAA